VIGKDATNKPIYGEVTNGSAKARANGTAGPAASRRRSGVRELGQTIKNIQAAGATSLRAIAAGLNAQGLRRGNGTWSAVQVARILEKIS
jgi:hypothetical protein